MLSEEFRAFINHHMKMEIASEEAKTNFKTLLVTMPRIEEG
jgi:hypothetical protein